MNDTDQAWREWGQIDPYFGVLTNEKFRHGSSRNDFFASGERLVSNALSCLDEHFGPVDRGRALDFGCGVGRLCIPLAQRFASVVGVDISPGMLAEARINGEGMPIDFRLSDETLSQVDGTFDLIFSFIVLQHMSVERGLAYLDQMLSATNANAGCIFQVPIARHEGSTVEVTARGQIARRIRSLPGGNALMNLYRRLKQRPARRELGGPNMQMNPYPLPKLIALLERHGFAKPLLVYGNQTGMTDVTIFSRKSS